VFVTEGICFLPNKGKFDDDDDDDDNDDDDDDDDSLRPRFKQKAYTRF